MNAIRNVVCGMSGGVDSAVAALLLKKRGFNVSGVFMRNWDLTNEFGQCTSDQDEDDARHVCKHLDIPFHTVNFVKEYWVDVFSQMLHGYEVGTTPNPDVLCNRHIKFGAFFDHVMKIHRADAVATGHYASNSAGNFLEEFDPKKGARLLVPVDKLKDQTLFLCQIPQRALQHTMFPIGHLMKDQVKEIARQNGLEKIASRKESMGICFIGSRNFHHFIEEYIEPKPGDFVDIETGKIVGHHKGTHYWTIGQRTHIGGMSKAYFVAQVNTQSQEILVASGTDHPALFSSAVLTHPAHWIHSQPSELEETQSTKCMFRFQHKHPLIHCTVKKTSNGLLKVELERPLRALTCGQYAVFHQNEECLGGAEIMEVGASLYELNQSRYMKHAEPFT